MHNKQLKESPLVAVFRVILGLVFIFSSFVKGVDPMGTTYRVEDYLLVYGLDWMLSLALPLSIFLITVEFLLGFAILFKLKPKLAALGVFLIMIFFTAVTWFDAYYNLVPDCGCFGDAIKLSNWETFYKNVVLIILAALVFFKSKSIVNKLPGWFQYFILIVFTGIFIWFTFYNYSHLPMLDFRDWKVGKDMKSSGEGQAKTFVTYKNKQTGEEKEYISPNYPWNDTVWMAEWTFVKQRLDESGIIRQHNLIIEDEDGNDLTNVIVENTTDQFLLISYDLDNANGEAMLQAAELFQKLDNNGIAFDMVCASDPSLIKKYNKVYQMEYPAYFADDIELKAMIRSNPGLVWLHNGVVMQKWHANDFPEWEELKVLMGK